MAKWSEEEHNAALVGEPAPMSPVVVEDYDPRWPEWYSAERAAIRSALDPRLVLRLEHVGSTSVPGLAAKPVVDILLVVTDASVEHRYVPALEAIGYRLAIREPDWYEHRVLTRRIRQGAPYDVNLHVFPPTAVSEIERMLAFRDWLRTHEGARARYERRKRVLAQHSWQSIVHYSNAKSDVVEDVLSQALPGQDQDTKCS